MVSSWYPCRSVNSKDELNSIEMPTQGMYLIDDLLSLLVYCKRILAGCILVIE